MSWTKGTEVIFQRKRSTIFISISFALCCIGFYFLSLAESDDPIIARSWYPNPIKLRQRSVYHEWRGSSSDWMKRSPLGRFVFVFDDVESRQQLVRTAVQGLAKESTEATNFVFVPSKTFAGSFHSIIADEDFPSFWPSAMLLEVRSGFRKYALPLKFEATTTSEELQATIKRNLIDAFGSGDIKPYLRNEVLPDEMDNDDLRSVNSSHFHNVLLPKKAEKEFFVLLHAPWCGHCRRYEAKLASLAHTIRSHTRGIGFYKIDATKNDIDHPEMAVTRVPHVRFFSAANECLPFTHRAEDLTGTAIMKAFLTTHSKEFSVIDEL